MPHLETVIKNERRDSVTIRITDRNFTVRGASPTAPTDQLTPGASLHLILRDGEEIVLLAEGITIRRMS